jgi:hypothetical protein
MSKGIWQRLDAKRIVESFPSLDIRALHREGLRSGTWSRGWGEHAVRVELIDQGTARVSYLIGHPAFEYVELDRTPAVIPRQPDIRGRGLTLTHLLRRLD